MDETRRQRRYFGRRFKRHVPRGNPFAVRTYDEIAAALAERYGITLTRGRVQQLCTQAERKLVEGLAAGGARDDG